jgi:hypothetical protein
MIGPENLALVVSGGQPVMDGPIIDAWHSATPSTLDELLP